MTENDFSNTAFIATFLSLVAKIVLMTKSEVLDVRAGG